MLKRDLFDRTFGASGCLTGLAVWISSFWWMPDLVRACSNNIDQRHGLFSFLFWTALSLALAIFGLAWANILVIPLGMLVGGAIVGPFLSGAVALADAVWMRYARNAREEARQKGTVPMGSWFKKNDGGLNEVRVRSRVERMVDSEVRSLQHRLGESFREWYPAELVWKDGVWQGRLPGKPGVTAQGETIKGVVNELLDKAVDHAPDDGANEVYFILTRYEPSSDGKEIKPFVWSERRDRKLVRIHVPVQFEVVGRRAEGVWSATILQLPDVPPFKGVSRMEVEEACRSYLRTLERTGGANPPSDESTPNPRLPPFPKHSRRIPKI